MLKTLSTVLLAQLSLLLPFSAHANSGADSQGNISSGEVSIIDSEAIDQSQESNNNEDFSESSQGIREGGCIVTLDQSTKKKLLNSARKARRWAHTPYSNYAVGASVLTSRGAIYIGATIENPSSTLSMCAERVAIFRSLMARRGEIKAIAIVAPTIDEPCGACRDVLFEMNPDMVVLISDIRGDTVVETTAADLLPRPTSTLH
jgi:cytidine deaminase